MGRAQFGPGGDQIVTPAARPSLAHAFRRAALPLASYYAVTLALPLANGAAQSGDVFVNHALVVLVVPPILILGVWTIQRAALIVAGACRSAASRWRSISAIGYERNDGSRSVAR